MSRKTMIVALILGTLSIVNPQPIAAHPAADWYDNYWGAGELPSIKYHHTVSVPTGGFRARVNDGADEWSDVGQVDLFFSVGDESQNFNPFQSCSSMPDKNAIHKKNGTGAYAVTVTCIIPSEPFFRIDNFQLVFEEGITWNKETAPPNPNEVDVWHTATHEFGHATGFSGHFRGFLQTQECPYQAYQLWETMCDSVDALEPPFGTEEGKQFRRSLETHDIHTFRNQYG